MNTLHFLALVRDLNTSIEQATVLVVHLGLSYYLQCSAATTCVQRVTRRAVKTGVKRPPIVLCREKKRTTSMYQSNSCKQTSIQDALKRFTLPVVSPAAWIQFPQHLTQANCGNFNHLIELCRSCCDSGVNIQMHSNADREGKEPQFEATS